MIRQFLLLVNEMHNLLQIQTWDAPSKLSPEVEQADVVVTSTRGVVRSATVVRFSNY